MSDKSISKEHLQSHLFGAIVERIISGEFSAGYRLVEEDLAQTYKVSRTPIREVLFALQKDGLVERVRNQGAKVASFTADDVEEVFDVRKALECFCIPSVIQTAKLNELLDLEHRLEALERGSGQKWSEKLAAIDMDIHGLIVNGSRNRRLIAYLKRISLLLHSLQLAGYRNEEHVRQSAREHLEIIRALLRRDVDRAQQFLADHIENGKRHALELFFASLSARH
jgi:DNA-binding GntR family transcriptional regulator